MGYIAPELKGLTRSVSILEQAYNHKNQSRLQLISLLKHLHEFIQDISSDISDEEARDICLGAWVYCHEAIPGAPYPTPWFHKGSVLKYLIEQELNISKQNQLDDKKKLIYLIKFYNFLLENKEYLVDGQLITIQDAFLQSGMTIPDLRHNLKGATQKLLNAVCADIDKVMKAIPTEPAVHSHISKLTEEYHNADPKNKPLFGTTKFENVEREFLTQLAEAVAALMAQAMKNESRVKLKNELTREQRIEMGALLYIMQKIYNEYRWLSPNRSRLYNRCYQIINNTVAGMDRKKMLECVTAFKNFIRHEENIVAIENYGVVHNKDADLLYPLDRKLDAIEREVDEMIVTTQTSILSCWRVASTFGLMVASIAAPVGYGVGQLTGFFASDTDVTVNPKLAVSYVLNDLAVTYIAKPAGYLGFLMADRTIQYTLERAFGKLFEQLFILASYAGVGAGTYLVLKMSVEGYSYLSGLVRDTANKAGPELAQNIDVEFIDCLCSLPSEVFSDDKKARLEYITYPQTHTMPAGSRLGPVVEEIVTADAPIQPVSSLNPVVEDPEVDRPRLK